MKDVKPNIYVTFNGDFFDWPFIDRRAEAHGISLFDEIGICDRDKSVTLVPLVHFSCAECDDNHPYGLI